MSTVKSAPLGLRLEPRIKWALEAAATREHRSVANMVEWLVLDHCQRVGIRIPEQGALALEAKDDERKGSTDTVRRRGR
jgi:hypothetical protein